MQEFLTVALKLSIVVFLVTAMLHIGTRCDKKSHK